MLDKLISKVSSIDDLKALYLESLLNHTSNVSKISEFSVLNAHAFGVAKLFQKDLKDSAVLESTLFPELSSGDYLDNAARMVGGISRLQASRSSGFVLVNAEVGTVYIPGVSYFVSTQGVNFSILEPVTVNRFGYVYVPVRSFGVGVNTNVAPLTINRVYNPPVGHISCTNEYETEGGRDIESDEDFKTRLLTFRQFAARSVRETLLAHLQELDGTIIKLIKVGYNVDGKVKLMIVTSNGQWFSQSELLYFQDSLIGFLGLSLLNRQGDEIGIELINTDWHQVGGDAGVDFRVELSTSHTESDIRKNIQRQLSKYFDFRYWDSNKVEWDDLLSIVKGVSGVKYVPDEFFLPNTDSYIPEGKLPRVIKFIMRNMNGDIIYNNVTDISPIYYGV